MKPTSFLATLTLATLAVASCSHSEKSRRHGKTRLNSTSSARTASPATQNSSTTAPLAAPHNSTTLPILSAQRGGSKNSSSSNSTSVGRPTGSPSPQSPSTGAASLGMPSWGFKKNGIAIGFLPDDGSGGGTAHMMTAIDKAMNGRSAAYGYYAQVQDGVPFDGAQLLHRMDDIKKSGGVFQPAVMPTGGWKGMTRSDNSQAVRIAKVMQLFVNEGLTVHLRYAHEVNWYQEDGTYQGDANDFKEGWAVVAAAIKEHAPSVKMWFTPNVRSLEQYDAYYPDDPSTVDIIGIDYYPMAGDKSFLETMKPFHDKYASPTTLFAIGETGLGRGADMQARLDWLIDATSVETTSQMKYYVALSWFNYHKGYEFRIADLAGDSIIAKFLA